jgi:hypothetical protein
MFSWSNDNEACSNLWTTLFSMHQLTSNFANSGTLKMQDLTFYNQLESAELRSQEANDIANHLDSVFVGGNGAKYQPGITQNAAVSKMAAVLGDGIQTVTDLASAANDCYIFF